MKKALFIATLILSVVLTIIACKKDKTTTSIVISGEFVKTSGTCTPYCLVDISGSVLTLKGIDYSGSTIITYQEIYNRSSSDADTYNMTADPGSYIKVISTTAFTFTSTSRTCNFSKD